MIDTINIQSWVGIVIASVALVLAIYNYRKIKRDR